MQGSGLVITEFPEPGVALLLLNRPPLNALNLALTSELAAALSTLGGRKDISVIVLSSRHRFFSAGVDLQAAREVFLSKEGLGHGGSESQDRDPVAQLMRVPQVTIAAVHGCAVTGGLELVLNCDLIVSHPGVKLQDTHAKLGIAPLWGLSQIMSRLVGMNRAREFSLTSNGINGTTAHQWGVINRLVTEPASPESVTTAALELAREVARNPGAKMVKRAINSGLALSLGDGRTREVELGVEYNRSEEFAAIAAQLNKSMAKTSKM